MEKKEFLDGYTLAISQSAPFKTVDKVRQLVSSVLSYKKDVNNTKDKDPLIDFVIKNMDLVPSDWFKGDLLVRAFRINVPGAIIISDTLTLSVKQLEFFKGIKYISGNRMLVFDGKNVILCDVKLCNPSDLINKFNDKAISRMNEWNNSIVLEGKKLNKTNTLESIMDQCRGLCFDYEDDDNI